MQRAKNVLLIACDAPRAGNLYRKSFQDTHMLPRLFWGRQVLCGRGRNEFTAKRARWQGSDVRIPGQQPSKNHSVV